MSTIVRVEAPGTGRGVLRRGGTPVHDRTPGYFTSRRSAVISLLFLAMVLALIALDLVAPLLG